MKTQILSILFSFLFLLNIISTGNMYAQTVPQNQETLKKEQNDDAKYLKGFDEKAIVTELKKKGIPESEYKRLINGRKKQYINKQKGIVEVPFTPFFPKPNPRNPLRNPSSGCPNANFEDTTFTGWTGGTGLCSNYPTPTVWTPGMNVGPVNAVPGTAAQQDLLTDPNGFDPNAGTTGGMPNIPYIAPGGGHVSARLGNSETNYGTEYLSYQIPVTINNTSFTYQYAVVLESPSGHTATQQPRFDITVFNAAGTAVTGPCGAYDVQGLGAATDPTFFPYTATTSSTVLVPPPFGGLFGSSSTTSTTSVSSSGYYKKWTTVTIDLTPYITQTMTIQFVTQDCTLGGHYGYAYIDAGCSSLSNQVLFCPGDTTCMIVAAPGFNSYQWYNAAGTAIPGATGDTLHVSNPFLGEQFSVALLSAAGCGSSITTTLAYSHMTTYQNHQDATCTGPNGWAYINQSGGTGPFTYTWIDSATHTNITQAAHPDSLTHIGGGTYYVTVQAHSGCSATDTIHVIQPSPLTVTHTGVPMCPTAVTASLTAPPGSGYQWYDPTNTLIAGATNSTYLAQNPVLGQTYTVHYLPPGGCASEVVDSFYYFNVNNPLHFGFPICPATPSTTITAPAGSGYQWFDPTNTLIAGANSSSYIAQNPSVGQIYTISYTPTGATCQVEALDSFYYLHFNLQGQTLVNPTCNANNGQASVTVTGGTAPYVYSWLPTGGSSNIASSLSAGTYTINVTDALGCTSSVVDTITNTNGVTATISTTPITCHNGSDGTATVTPTSGAAPYTYLWGNGNTTATINNIHSGNYCVKITASNGCIDSVCTNLSNPPAVIAQFYSQPIETDINNPNITFTNQSSDSTTWFWNFGVNGATSTDQNPSYSYTDIGTYPVMLVATNSKGCKDTVFHTIVIDGLYTFYAPNAFTPDNMDNSNTVFLPKGTGWDITTFKLMIFDRWGNFLFFSDDVTKGWDGRYKGSMSQIDVYVWKVTVHETNNGKEHDYIGSVSLVR